MIVGLVFVCWSMQAEAVDRGAKLENAIIEGMVSSLYQTSSGLLDGRTGSAQNSRGIPVNEPNSSQVSIVEQGLDDVYPFVYKKKHSKNEQSNQLLNALYLIGSLEDDLAQMEAKMLAREEQRNTEAAYLWLIITILVVCLGVFIYHKYKQDLNRVKEIKRRNEIIATNKKHIVTHNEELKKFAYVTSHNLKAPLRGIAHISEWLSRDYADALDRRGKELFELMQSRVKKMDYLLDDMLTYFKMSSKEIIPEPVNIKKMVEAIANSISTTKRFAVLANKNLPIILAGRLSVYQLFYNLIDNAIKYNDKPFIKIEAGIIKRNSEWYLFIRDNGDGIEEKHQHKIFEMFQTINRSEEDDDSTGIGLAVVKKIVDNWGSEILLESETEVGSTFYIRIPEYMLQEPITILPDMEVDQVMAV